MRTPLTKFSAILGTTLLFAALSSCSEDPRPIIEPSAPTSSPPATPTPTATPTAPERESAKAFIRRWERVSTAMQVTGDTAPYLVMTDDCSSCLALAEQVSKIYAAGGSVITRGGFVSSIVRRGGVDGVVVLDYTVKARPSEVLDASGDVESRFPGGTSIYQINLKKTSKKWLVQRISRLES